MAETTGNSCSAIQRVHRHTKWMEESLSLWLQSSSRASPFKKEKQHFASLACSCRVCSTVLLICNKDYESSLKVGEGSHAKEKFSYTASNLLGSLGDNSNMEHALCSAWCPANCQSLYYHVHYLVLILPWNLHGVCFFFFF